MRKLGPREKPVACGGQGEGQVTGGRGSHIGSLGSCPAAGRGRPCLSGPKKTRVEVEELSPPAEGLEKHTQPEHPQLPGGGRLLGAEMQSQRSEVRGPGSMKRWHFRLNHRDRGCGSQRPVPAEAQWLNVHHLGDAGGPLAEPWRECRKESQEPEFVKALVSSWSWGAGNVGVERLVNSGKGQFWGMPEGEEVEASNGGQESPSSQRNSKSKDAAVSGMRRPEGGRGIWPGCYNLCPLCHLLLGNRKSPHKLYPFLQGSQLETSAKN